MNKSSIELIDIIKRHQQNSEKSAIDAAVKYAEKSELKDQVEFNMYKSFAMKTGWLLNEVQKLLVQVEKEAADSARGDTK